MALVLGAFAGKGGKPLVLERRERNYRTGTGRVANRL